YFMQQSEEQVSMIILEARANDLLFIGETEEDEGPIVPTSFPVIH
ncbi:YbjN domain-containing protein, partial [Salmonella enterica subsp. enterica serovar Enteritidis]